MRLTELTDTFARLEKTRGRREAVSLVSRVLDRVSPAEREATVYLLQGQLRPAFEGVEIGLGERLLIRALGRAYGTTQAGVGRRFRRLGDLGLVAESLADPATRGRLSVTQAYRALLGLSEAGGAGSQNRKITQLSALLHRATTREARYLVRIVQGRLRLGVGDATLLEAAALGALGDRGRKPLLEEAYNVRSDLGAVIALAYRRGARGLARMTPHPGIPVRPALAQRLPSAAAIIGRHATVQVEPKYDGLRLQIHRDGDRIWIFSRRLENVTAMFPDLGAAARRLRHARRFILEGEAVAQDPTTGRFLPFQVTMTRKRTHGLAEAVARRPLRCFAFDLLYAGRTSYLPKPQQARRRRLAALVRGGRNTPLVVTEAWTVRDSAGLDRIFDAMVSRGLEGIMAKRLDAPYRAGARGYDWVKLKRSYRSALRDTVDLVVVGYLVGRGQRAALGIGSLLGAVYDPGRDRFRTAAKIGSGLPRAEWKALRERLDRQATRVAPKRVEALITPDVWVDPKIVVEVRADEITRSPRHTCGREGGRPGYALRFPRLVRVRDDRAPEDATSEREVVELFRGQARRAGGTVSQRTTSVSRRGRSP